MHICTHTSTHAQIAHRDAHIPMHTAHVHKTQTLSLILSQSHLACFPCEGQKCKRTHTRARTHACTHARSTHARTHACTHTHTCTHTQNTPKIHTFLCTMQLHGLCLSNIVICPSHGHLVCCPCEGANYVITQLCTISTHSHTHARMHARTHACTHAHMHIHTPVHKIHKHTTPHTHPHTHTHTQSIQCTSLCCFAHY